MRHCLAVLGLLVVAASAGVSPVLADDPEAVVLETDSLRLAPVMTQLRIAERDLDIDAIRERAEAGAFERIPGGEDPAYGYTDDVLWLHARLRVPADTVPEEYRLRLGYSFIDDVRFHAFRDGDRVVEQRAGSRTPRADWPVPAREPVFELAAAEPGTYDLFFRVDTRGSLNAPVTLWTAESFAEQQVFEALVYSLFYGVVLTMALYNAALYLAIRDRNYLYYVLMLASMVTYVMALHGYAGRYLWPELGEWSSFLDALAGACTGFMVFQFSRSFLELRQGLPRYDRLLLAGQWLWASTPILLLVVGYAFAMGLQTLMVLATTLTVAGAGLLSLWRGVRRARFFLAAWLALLVGATLFGLTQLGLLPGNPITRNAVQLGSSVEVILLSLALADRMHLENQRHNQLLERARRRLEERVRERSEQLQDALTRLAAKNAELANLNRRDALTGVYNRRGLDEMIAQQWARLLEQPQPLTLLMFDLDGFKAINDRWGHAFGDYVLEEVVRRARGALYRDSDYLARYGGEEFVALLLNTDVRDGVIVAERLRQAVAEAVIRAGQQDIRVTVSVGQYTIEADGLRRHAQIPAAHEVIERVDHALYRAKADGGNRVVQA